jgi:hypothetical protein
MTVSMKAAAEKTQHKAAAKPASAGKPGSKPRSANARVRDTSNEGKAAKASKPERPKKLKLVRDSFTMPEDEYALIAELKKRCLAAGIAAKKSEILRAAVVYLAQAGDSLVVRTVRRLAVVKTGRPAKSPK